MCTYIRLEVKVRRGNLCTLRVVPFLLLAHLPFFPLSAYGYNRRFIPREILKPWGTENKGWKGWSPIGQLHNFPIQANQTFSLYVYLFCFLRYCYIPTSRETRERSATFVRIPLPLPLYLHHIIIHIHISCVNKTNQRPFDNSSREEAIAPGAPCRFIILDHAVQLHTFQIRYCNQL